MFKNTNLKFSNDKLNIKSLENLWKNNSRKTVLYLHNPFCVTANNCKYCMHKGCPSKKHTTEEVEKFYFEYMPKLFKIYEKIINSQDIVLVDFGGGTPNYLSAEKFDKYCSLLPSKLQKVNKIIELHPALVSKEFIDVLKKHNFTTLIFCFQTFNDDILLDNGRLIPNYDNAFECIKYAKELGFNIATDLITYWTTEDGWWKVLEEDLNIIKQLDVDEVTISVLYQNKYGNEDFNDTGVYRRIYTSVKKYLPDYINPENTLEQGFNVAATRLYKPDSNVFKDFSIYINSLSDIPWEHEQGYSTLGIGTYKNGDKASYSIIGPDILIYEKFNGFKENPSWHIHRKYNFWQSARNVIDALEKEFKENPPVGTNLVLSNICESINKDPFAHSIQGNCKWAIAPRVCYSGKSSQEENLEIEFENKLNNVDKNKVREYNCKTKGENNE